MPEFVCDLTGVVTADSQKGYFWIEVDSTFATLFLHQSNVKNRRHLHVNDRVRFDVEPNPKRPGEMQAVRAEFIGIQIARQVSDTVQS